MRKWFLNLPGEDLGYFSEGTDHFDGYVEAVGRAQDYAALNRRMTMMTNLIRAMRGVIVKPFDAGREAINCHAPATDTPSPASIRTVAPAGRIAVTAGVSDRSRRARRPRTRSGVRCRSRMRVAWQTADDDNTRAAAPGRWCDVKQLAVEPIAPSV